MQPVNNNNLREGMESDKSFLKLEGEENQFYEQLLLQAGQAQGAGDYPPEIKTQSVLPKPGFCLKTKTDKDEKVFINICQCSSVPAPVAITDDELIKLLEQDDQNAGGYRIPMSLGEPHAELDNKGAGCTAYDVVVSPDLMGELNTRQVLLGFFITVVIEGLQYKYSLTLDPEWKILKNRKFVGSLPEQNIRTSSKPLIMEMDEQPEKKKLISEMDDSPSEPASKPKAPEPPYTLLGEPPEGRPEYIVAEMHMPKVKTADSLMLDIGEDRLVLETRSNVYHLDIFLPYNLIQEECGAQFNRNSRILSVTMPVQPLL